MGLPMMADASHRARPVTFTTSRPESTTANTFGNIKPAGNTQAVVGQAVDEAERYCVLCQESISLLARSVKLSACQHILHERCHRLWAYTEVEHNPLCPRCHAPTTRIISCWNSTTQSYVHQITKEDLYRPEPLVSAPMIFHVDECRQSVLVALAFKHYPSVCAQRAGTVPPRKHPTMTLVTDKAIALLKCNLGKFEVSLVAGCAILPVFWLEKIKSFLWQKAMKLSNCLTGYPVNPYLPQHVRSCGDPFADPDGCAIVFHPGVPVKSITAWCNTISLMSHVLSFGARARWLFPDTEKMDQWGERLTCLYYLKRDMDWQPVIGASSDNGNNEGLLDQSVDAEEEVPEADDSRSGWQDFFKLDLLVSYSPDGRNPFASLSDITFESNRLNGCLEHCLSMDQISQTDDNYRRYQEDFDRGIEALKDDRAAIYVHLRMRQEAARK